MARVNHGGFMPARQVGCIFKNMIVAFLLLGAPQLSAQIIGLESYQGNACPQGSVSASTTDDGGIISILFDQFSAETSSSAPWVIKNCSLTVAVNVPEGYRISQVQAEQRGFFLVPQGSYGRVQTQVAATHNRRWALNAHNYIVYSQPFEDSFSLVVNAKNQQPNRTTCADRQEKISISSQVWLLTRQAQSGYALAAIDSIDASLSSRAPSSYSVLFEKCPVRPGRPVRPYPRWPNHRQKFFHHLQ